MSIQYHIAKLDCPSCAAKIENAVNRIPGVEMASIDFLSRILHITAPDKPPLSDTVKAAVRSVEPGASVIPYSLPDGDNHAGSHEPEKVERFMRPGVVLPLAISLILFGFVLFAEYSAKGPVWIKAGLAAGILAWVISGAGVLKKSIFTVIHGQLFDENVLMVIATIGAISIGAVSEAAGVMIFYRIGELLQGVAVGRSKNAITALLATRPDTANLYNDGVTRRVSARRLKPGDMIMIRPGERVPADGQVVSGQSFLDTAALTGEPVPKAVGVGGDVLAGMINADGLLTVRVTRPFADSTISKMIALVESSGAKKAKTERFITTFARYYTPAVVLCAAAIAVVPPLVFNAAHFSDWLYRALVLLVISCPCALMISIPLGYFGGIGRASKMGILVKGAEFIDTLAKLKTIVFDKTGTLTRGVFTVSRIVTANGFSENDLLTYAAKAERHSNHPIAQSIIRAAVSRGISVDTGATDTGTGGGVDGYDEFPGKGVRAVIDGRTLVVGTEDFLRSDGIEVGRTPDDSGTLVHVAKDNTYAGVIHIGDEIHPRAKDMVPRLRKMGVETLMMLTGDNHEAAKDVAEDLGLDGFSAGLLPDGKVRAFEGIMARKRDGNKSPGRVAFVGDGINDAPVLARADVGIAMGALGSDAAIASADVVLMADSPMRVADAVAVSRRTRIIVWQNIFLALTIKGVFIGLGVFGMATMWEAVFADVGTALLAVINSTRVLKIGL